MNIKNIFSNLPQNIDEEMVDNILTTDKFIVERIISECHSSPKDFWYDQDTNEFMLLVSGSAGIMFEDGEVHKLIPGDYLIIEAHKKHRVDYTDSKMKTVWLTIHYKD